MLQLCLGLTFLAGETGYAFYILTAQSLPLTITSYLVPIIICLLTKERLQPGPWNMGTWGPMVRIGAVIYLLLALLIVLLPAALPLTAENLPYAPIMAVACVLFMQVCWWFPVIGGRHFYSGPGSEGVGRVRLAISSPVLTPSRRIRSAKSTAVVPVRRRDFHRLAQAASLGPAAGTQLVQPRFESHWKRLGVSWGWLNPRAWFARAAAAEQYDLDSCRPSPNNFYRQPALRIPGENEALNRAKSSPTHPSGYAWDREAAKRLGHKQQELSTQKSFQCR